MARLLVCVLLALLAPAAAAPRSLVVHPNERAAWAVPRRHAALGIEYLNHEIYGGLSSQMVFGESFEEGSLAAAQVRRGPADGVRAPGRPADENPRRAPG
jgi:hypothetical protein